MPLRHPPAVHTLGEDEKPLIGPLLRHAYRWFQDGVLAGLAARDQEPLTLAQIDIFANLDADGTTIAELARRSGVARQSAHQAVGELVRAGVLRVDPDPSSARNKLVRPTKAGLARLRGAQQVLVDVEQQLVEQLGERKVEQLRTLLDRDWSHSPDQE